MRNSLLLFLILSQFCLSALAQKVVTPDSLKVKKTIQANNSKSANQNAITSSKLKNNQTSASNGSIPLQSDNASQSNDSKNLIQTINAEFDQLEQDVELEFAKLQNENRSRVDQLNDAIKRLDNTNDSLTRKFQQQVNLNADKEGPKGNTPNVSPQQNANLQQTNQLISQNNQKKILYTNQIKQLDNKLEKSNSEKLRILEEIKHQRQDLLQDAQKTKDPKQVEALLSQIIKSTEQTSEQIIQNLK